MGILVDGNELDSVLLFRKTQPPNTTRVLANRVAKEARAIEDGKIAGDFKITDVMHLVAGKRRKEAEKRNDAQDGIYSAGPVIGLIDELLPCKTVIERMMAQAEEVISGRLAAMVRPSRL